MALTNPERRTRATWQQNLLAFAVLLALAGLVPIIISSCYSGCGYGCSGYSKKTTFSSVRMQAAEVGDPGSIVPGEEIERELLISMAPDAGLAVIAVEWTPPDGASAFTFVSHQPDNPNGPPPFRFSSVPVGSPADPVQLRVGYTAPTGVFRAINDTFHFFDPQNAQTLHVSSLTNPVVGTVTSQQSMRPGRRRDAVDSNAAAKLFTSERSAWTSELWIYPHQLQVFDEPICQQVFDAVASGHLFMAVHYPRRVVGTGVPIVLNAGHEPRIALLDYNQPSDQREVLSFDLELAPERMSWIANNMTSTDGFEWTALKPRQATVPTCPDGFGIDAGFWEFFNETLIDYTDEPDNCNDCVLEHYVCWEGQEPPVVASKLSTGALGMTKSVQAEGVTCIGPGAVRLVDGDNPPEPAFTMVVGETAVVLEPPERVIFGHWLGNFGSPSSYTINLTAESSLGIQWSFYSDPNATNPLNQPVSVPSSSSLEFWVAADIPAGASGIESVRVEATATSAPSNPVWGTDTVHIGDWVPPPEASSVASWIPVVSRASGVGGSQWRTDLGLLNPGGVEAGVLLRLYSGDETLEQLLTVVAGQQQILGDVVSLFAVEGSGALEIEADQSLIATSRTYSLMASDATCSPNGTFGQFLAGNASSSGLAAGQSGRLPQLAENDGYRTNLAVTNTGAQPAAVTVILYDGAGTEITTFDLDLAPGQWRQVNRVFFSRGGRADLVAASAEIRVTTGTGVLAYASVVDNTTTDPTTIPLMTGGGATMSWVPVASRAAGVGGSQWRTDLGLLNSGSSPANVTVRYHSGGSTFELQVQVVPGQQLVVDDVVGQFASDGSGAVEVVSDQPIIVTSRTYSLLDSADPCYPNGTFGQFLAGQESAEGLDSGQPGWLPQLQENAAYRTNLALTNTGTENAAATVVLLDGGGSEITRFDLELGPGEWKQENRVFFRRGGRADLAAASARIEVTAGGGVLAYASVVDNITTDPTTIPLQR